MESTEVFSNSNNNKQKKFAKKLTNLQIIIEDDTSVPLSPLPTLKKSDISSRIYSVRNFNKKRFEFPTSQIDKHLEMEQTVQKLEMLKNEKNNLLLELQELRNVAVNALIQKQDQIQKLKEKMVQVTNSHHQEQQNEAEIIIQQLQKATQQIEQLKKQLQLIRSRYENELQNKNQMIEDLNNQLEATKLKVQDLKFQDQILTQKLKIAEGENEQLHNELLNSKIHMSVLQQSMNNSKILNISEIGDSQKSGGGKKHFEFKLLKTDESHRSDVKQQIEFDEYYDKIDQLCELSKKQRQKHQKQMQQLQNFYEQKFEMTRIQFENELHQFKDQNSQSHSQSMHSQDFNIQITNHDQKKQIPHYQHILKTEEDKNEFQVKSIQSNYSRRSSLPKTYIQHPTNKHQQADNNSNQKNFMYERTTLSNIKQKYNQQYDKAIQSQKKHKKQLQKKIQDNFSCLNYFLEKKNQVGIVLASAIVSGLLFSIIKIKK